MRYVMGALLLIPSLAAANAAEEEAWDKLLWDFSGFTQSFEQQTWQGLERYVTPQTKAGFGGEHGMDGLRQVYGDGGDCFQAMVLALKQGCRKQHGAELTCHAPPQWHDPQVIYLGARAGFRYWPGQKRWLVDYLICGGD